ncbi:MAG: VWA domain-containing protein [Phycisphaeraceae bacterium]
MTLLQPIWLLLFMPLLVSWWLWPLPTRPLRVLRLVTLVVVTLAMAGPALRLGEQAGTIVVVADRSRSMPADADARQREAIDLLTQAMSPRDRLAVVSFGDQASVERPADSARFAGFSRAADGDASNLADAIDRAMSLVPGQQPARILLLSDGIWTGRDPIGPATRAAAREVAIDHRHVGRSLAGDLAIQRLETPARVDEAESFMFHAWVRSPVPRRIAYELRRSGQVIAGGERDVGAGVTRLTFRDRGGGAGTHRYTLHLPAAEDDPLPENNTAHSLVEVRGRQPLLVLSTTPGSALAGLLRAAGLDVELRSPEAMDWSLETLSSYRALMLENVPARDIPHRGLAQLAGWVETVGGGLTMTGGRRSFGPGGYFDSPIDPILPVSMELRQEHRKLAVAVLVTMDRSGSMTAPVAGGQTKMDLANLASARVLDMLSPFDEYGVMAVDTRAHAVAPLAPVPAEPASLRDRVLRIESTGGGIYIGEALRESLAMLRASELATRHLILFADAADSVQAGNYRRLLDAYEREGITVSVVGMGTERDKDAPLLRDIAERGRGRSFFTEDARRLPELFAEDMITVARSTFITDPTAVQATPALAALTGQRYGSPPPLGGYNLTYLREGASMAMVTEDEYDAPVVATWHAGLGRVAAYTGEADGQHTGPIGGWTHLGSLLTSLARWTAGQSDTLGEDIAVTAELDRGLYRVEVHLDPERASEVITDAPVLHSLHDATNGEPERRETPLTWVAADRLRAEIALDADATVLGALRVPGRGQHRLAPVRLPYSPEFAPPERDGAYELRRLARVTGGAQQMDLAGIWADLPRAVQYRPMAVWLLIAAICLVLCEVLERRTAMAARMRWPRWRRAPATPAIPTTPAIPATPATGRATVPAGGGGVPQGRRRSRAGVAGAGAAGAASGGQPNVQGDGPAPAAPPSLADALSQARARAGSRHRRGNRGG